jgi:leader peptidase (prepilin peptidase) / N-methyltransferase
MAGVRTGAAAALDGHASGKAKASPPAYLVGHLVPVLLIASFFAGTVLITAPSAGKAVLGAGLAVVLVVLAATDLERRIIPNRIVLPAIGIALVANIAIAPGRSPEFILATLGLGVAFLIPNLINASLMGMGDVKLIMLLGAALGWVAVDAVAVAFISIFPVALATLIRGGFAARRAALPFGPFLAFGGLVVLLVPHLTGLG